MFATVAVSLLLYSCHGKTNENTSASTIDYTKVDAPQFNADSAYSFVERQLAFGFRAPGHKGHDACAAYLASELARLCDTCEIQHFSARLWDGAIANGQNIIGVVNPQASMRIFLSAHWDSRLWADHDPDESKRHDPIMGANDGASGVGVLLEVARAMQQQKPELGVDIIFFDLEDQGLPEWAERNYDDESWCKGSQYWAKNPHRLYYQARYGILLDMVGVSQARFTKEGFSMQYASSITNKLWEVASCLGYSNVFENLQTDPILDDHYFINTIKGIPTANIVQNSPQCSFYPYWHTLKDDMSAVDKKTLGIVGEVLITTIYAQSHGK